MKELLAVVSLLVSGVVGEAPYPPSGWRPSGPTLELPQRGQNPQPDYLPPLDPRNVPQKQQNYLPPVDPRNPAFPGQDPNVDVSVQGLPPPQEQLPIFQLSPVNGQQYVGPTFNADVRNLDQRFQQSQFEAQQEIYRQLARQGQLEAAQANGVNRQNQQSANRPNQIPQQFVPRTTPSPTQSTTTEDFRTTQAETTTESLNLNEGEITASSDQKKQKVTVEVSKQNIQEFPPELYLNPLAQLKLQSQFAPIQLGQIRAPIYFQPGNEESQKQIAGYDAQTHFAALPSVLAQQQLLQQAPLIQYQPQVVQNQPELVQSQPQLVQQPQLIQGQTQYAQPQYAQPQYAQPQYAQPQPQPQLVQQPQFVQPQLPQQPQFIQGQQAFPQNQGSFLVPNGQQTNQYEPALNSQYQPLVSQYQPVVNQYEQAQPQAQTFPQYQGQQVILQPRTNQIQPDKQKSDADDDQNQPQFVYQQTYQPEIYQQPLQGQGNLYQPQAQLVTPEQLMEFYNQLVQGQLTQGQFVQGQLAQQPSQGQDNLQSGLDVNQQGNGIDQNEEKEFDENDDGATATAVATAFGARTQPRVYSTYGAPVPVPRVQANPGYQTTTEPSNQDEAVTEDASATAEAIAVARGGRKSAKLRRNRVRPVFTLDRSGHLVLAQDQ